MKPPLPVAPQVIAAECICLGLQRVARVIARRYDEALRPLDLNNGQFSLLASVAGLQPAGIQALADHLAMDRTTATAALKPLARRGLVTIDVAKHDRRAREVSLSPEGVELLRRATALWSGAQRDAARRLGRDSSGPMLSSLHRLC
jgi:DNA-binding MarR family transcriptional regulator